METTQGQQMSQAEGAECFTHIGRQVIVIAAYGGYYKIGGAFAQAR